MTPDTYDLYLSDDPMAEPFATGVTLDEMFPDDPDAASEFVEELIASEESGVWIGGGAAGETYVRFSPDRTPSTYDAARHGYRADGMHEAFCHD